MLNVDTMLNIAINAVLIIIFLVRQSCTIETLKSRLDEFKVDIQEKLKENRKYTDNLFTNFKNEIREKLSESKKHADEHLNRIEEKQDKHNSLINRMYIVESKIEALEDKTSATTSTKKRKVSK